jgi:hypothetical protein
MQAYALAVGRQLQDGRCQILRYARNFAEMSAAGPVPADEKAIFGRAVHQQNAAFAIQADNGRVQQVQQPMGPCRISCH